MFKGQASEIEIEYREIQKVKQELYEGIGANTGQSYDRIYADAIEIIGLLLLKQKNMVWLMM